MFKQTNYEGRFIVLEGLDYSGKSKVAEALAKLMTEQTGRETVVYGNPGGDAFGEKLRELFKSSDERTPDVDFMLLATNHLHLIHLVKKALSEGKHVIVDRWYFSSHVYQTNLLSGVLKDRFVYGIMPTHEIMHDLPTPDDVVWLDCDAELTWKRVQMYRPVMGDTDRYEGDFSSKKSFLEWFKPKYEAYRDIFCYYASVKGYNSARKEWIEKRCNCRYKAPVHPMHRKEPVGNVNRYIVQDDTPEVNASLLYSLLFNDPVGIYEQKYSDGELAQYKKLTDDILRQTEVLRSKNEKETHREKTTKGGK